MTIKQNEFNEFIKKVDPILSRYPSCLESRRKFSELRDNQDFKAENHEMYAATEFFLIEAPDWADRLSPEDLESYLLEIEKFVEKWETRPISSWLFCDSTEGLKEVLATRFHASGKFETIEVYPWSTKEDVKAEFDEIRKRQPYIPIRPELYAVNFKIKALRDANWHWAEIQSFLTRENGTDVDKQVESASNSRTAELKKAGKNEGEIDEILDREFPLYQVDQQIENEINYDALRKRKDAADKLCEEFLGLFKIGK